VEDVGLPLIAALSVIGAGRLLIHSLLPLPVILLSLIVMFALALGFAALAAPRIRTWMSARVGAWIQILIEKTGNAI
jgi:hypothetical protein